MQTIVVPETNERWVNLVHIARKKTRDLSMSSRNSSNTYGRKSEITPGTIDDRNLLGVPGMMKRTSRTSKGSREESRKGSSKSKEKELRLPSLRKYSCDAIEADFANLSTLIEKKSDHSKASKAEENHNEHSAFRSRIRRNMVCEYIK